MANTSTKGRSTGPWDAEITTTSSNNADSVETVIPNLTFKLNAWMLWENHPIAMAVLANVSLFIPFMLSLGLGATFVPCNKKA